MCQAIGYHLQHPPLMLVIERESQPYPVMEVSALIASG